MNPFAVLGYLRQFVAPTPRTASSSDDARTGDSPSPGAGTLYTKPELITIPVDPRPTYEVGGDQWCRETLIAGRIKAGLR